MGDERHASAAGFAVVILSPDDEARLRGSNGEFVARARQNVIYELDQFHGRLGRGNVVALLVDGVEQPSDIAGVLYLRMDPGGAWRTELTRELAAAGIGVDADELLR